MQSVNAFKRKPSWKLSTHYGMPCYAVRLYLNLVLVINTKYMMHLSDLACSQWIHS